MAPIDDRHPDLPPGLASVAMPVVDATPACSNRYGRLVDDPKHCRIKIVRSPASGTHPVDVDTGDQAGTAQGVFVSEWRGEILCERNEAI